MSKDTFRLFKVILIAFATFIGTLIFPEAQADHHYFSLKKIFPKGKCSPVIPNYELMASGFEGGEVTKYKIHDRRGQIIEVISLFVNKTRDQWVIVV